MKKNAPTPPAVRQPRNEPTVETGGALGVLQPVFLPWMGYFEQIAIVDHFVLLDDVQYTKQDWRNRNRVKTAQGAKWITVPVRRRGLMTSLNQIQIADDRSWPRRPLRTIEQSYGRCPFFRPLFDDLSHVLRTNHTRLVDLTTELIDLFCVYLSIDTPIIRASEVSGIAPPGGDPSRRLIGLCESFGAKTFYEGASGRDYLDLASFCRAEIDVVFQDYQHPTYAQAHGGFLSHMSTLDLIMNVGPEARGILLSSPLPRLLHPSRGGGALDRRAKSAS